MSILQSICGSGGPYFLKGRWLSSYFEKMHELESVLKQAKTGHNWSRQVSTITECTDGGNIVSLHIWLPGYLNHVTMPLSICVDMQQAFLQPPFCAITPSVKLYPSLVPASWSPSIGDNQSYSVWVYINFLLIILHFFCSWERCLTKT